MRFQDVRLCIISCHLAAHRRYLKERNQDMSRILAMAQKKLGTRSVSYLSDWDYLFLIGDLNYRLDLSHLEPAPTPLEAKVGAWGDLFSLFTCPPRARGELGRVFVHEACDGGRACVLTKEVWSRTQENPNPLLTTTAPEC
jgi:hypothetical protein